MGHARSTIINIECALSALNFLKSYHLLHEEPHSVLPTVHVCMWPTLYHTVSEEGPLLWPDALRGVSGISAAGETGGDTESWAGETDSAEDQFQFII